MESENLTPKASEVTTVYHREPFDAIPIEHPTRHEIERWTQFRDRYHEAQALANIQPFPLQLDFELHSHCNLRCGFCVHGIEKVTPQALSRPLYTKALREGMRHGLVSIKLNYINEPLLAPDLCDRIREAYDFGILNTYFATNGVLLNEKAALALIEARASKILISLDAATPETYLKMRGSTRFKAIQDNIHRLIRLRDERGRLTPIVRVNFLKTAENIHEVDLFIEQWEGVADSFGFQELLDLPGTEENTWVKDAVQMQARKDFSSFRCSFPFKQVVIDHRGDLLPCCSANGRSMPLGNLATMTIEEAWHAMHELRAQHMIGGWRENPVCRHCVGG